MTEMITMAKYQGPPLRGLDLDFLMSAIRGNSELIRILSQAGVPIPVPKTPTFTDSNPAEIGVLVPNKGVGLGDYLPNPEDPKLRYRVYAAPNFLTGIDGKPLFVNIQNAHLEICRAGGQQIGNGLESELKKALKNGTYVDGTPVMITRELLCGQESRPGHNVRDLILARSLGFNDLLAKAQSATDKDNCVVTCTDGDDFVYMVRRFDPITGQQGQDSNQQPSRIMTVSFFRQQLNL